MLWRAGWRWDVADPIALEAVRRRMERSAAVTHFQMKRRLRGLAVVAYIAPMVGLLGTCKGIIDAFKYCSNASIIQFLTGGLAEGLAPFALAIGLPAFWAHRHLSRYADELELEMARASDQLIDYLESR